MITQQQMRTIDWGNVLLGTILFMISSKVVIPIYPVPITGQTLAVYFLGLILSPKESFLAALGWVTCGVLGTPVFTAPFGGPSSGYIIGMLLATPIIGLLVKSGWFALHSFLVAYAIVHVFGCFWLLNFIEWQNVFTAGVAPFILPEALKIVLVSSIVSYWKFDGN
jgi:biotin transport system substrate-specific component